MMDIKPIRSESDYETVLKEIEQLLEAEPGTPEDDRLEVLSTLAAAYEDVHYKIPLPNNAAEVLEYFMEKRSLSRADLIPYLGSRQRVSEVLNRKRGLSLEMIRRLHNGLGIPAELLIGEIKADGSEPGGQAQKRQPVALK